MKINEILQKISCPLTLSIEAQNKFDIYYELLKTENEKYNLTGITEEEDVFIKHFADSLTGYRLLPKACTVLDVGAGAGFPSVPLLIARPDIKVTLIDSVNKKVNFIKLLLSKLQLDAQVLHVRAEDYREGRGKFDIIVSRAVAGLPTLLEYTLPFLKVGGKVLAYKTDGSEILSAAHACDILGGNSNIKIHDFSYLEYSRVILEIKKIKPTPDFYPRGGNKPRTAPV